MGIVEVLTHSQHVNVLLNLIPRFRRLVNCLFINFNFYRKINLFGVQSHLYKKKIGGDSIDLFLVFQVEWETVMTTSLQHNIYIHIKSKTWNQILTLSTLRQSILENEIVKYHLYRHHFCPDQDFKMISRVFKLIVITVSRSTWKTKNDAMESSPIFFCVGVIGHQKVYLFL